MSQVFILKSTPMKETSGFVDLIVQQHFVFIKEENTFYMSLLVL